MAGLKNKDRGFWQEIEKWDVMVLIETWIDEKGWEKIQSKLPKGSVM